MTEMNKIHIVTLSEKELVQNVILTPDISLAEKSFAEERFKLMTNYPDSLVLYDDYYLFELDNESEGRIFARFQSFDVTLSNDVWYVEQWDKTDLINALYEVDLPDTEEILNYFSDYVKNIFDDKSERNELLNDKAYQLKSLINILEAHGLELKDIDRSQISFYLRTNHFFDSRESCYYFYKENFNTLLDNSKIIKTSNGYVSINIA